MVHVHVCTLMRFMTCASMEPYRTRGVFRAEMFMRQNTYIIPGRFYSESWDEATAGKSLCVRLLAPWRGHCQRVKPAWDDLMERYNSNLNVFIADVDCTAGGNSLCGDVGVIGYPTIKHGGPADLQDYEGGRDLSAPEDCPNMHPDGRDIDTAWNPSAFGRRCKRRDCFYDHPEGRRIDDNPEKGMCKYSVRCNRPDCLYDHPEGRTTLRSTEFGCCYFCHDPGHIATDRPRNPDRWKFAKDPVAGQVISNIYVCFKNRASS